MELSKDELKEILDLQAQESDERMQRYIGLIKEDTDHKFEVIMEYVKDIPEIKEKQEMMFEKIGEMAEDITETKETVKDHEVRLQKLEAV